MSMTQEKMYMNVDDVCAVLGVSKAFAYKIIREMEMNELVKSERGNQGGYYLNKKLDDLTMYDVVSITEEDLAIVHCMKEPCSRDTDDLPCKVHQEMERLQEMLNAELKSKKISEIIG